MYKLSIYVIMLRVCVYVYIYWMAWKTWRKLARLSGARNFLIDFIRSLPCRRRSGAVRHVIYSPFLDFPHERNYRRDTYLSQPVIWLT